MQLRSGGAVASSELPLLKRGREGPQIEDRGGVKNKVGKIYSKTLRAKDAGVSGSGRYGFTRIIKCFFDEHGVLLFYVRTFFARLCSGFSRVVRVGGVASGQAWCFVHERGIPHFIRCIPRRPCRRPHAHQLSR